MIGQIYSESFLIKRIPVTIYYDATKKKMPLVFIFHGFNSNKDLMEEKTRFGMHLAEKGFYAVYVDAYMHGERSLKRFTNASQATKEKMLMEIVVHTGKEIDLLIDYFAEKEECDSERVGITGISMGGMITFYAIGNNPRIQVAVPILGTPYFEKFILDKVTGGDYTVARNYSKTFNKVLTSIRESDPKDQIANFAPKPLLMLNGKRDRQVPPGYAEDLYQKLKSMYSDPKRLKLKLHDVEHTVSNEMKDEMIAWFEMYL